MASASDYVLGSSVETERLERQGDLHGRDRPLRHISLVPSQRFLDGGCGSGWVSRVVARAYPESEVIGVDINPDYVAYARARAEDEGLTNVRYDVADLQSLPFSDRTFDVVWSQFVLYFVPDPHRAMDEFARVTRPGGTVLAAVHKFPAHSYPPPTGDLEEKVVTFAQAVLRGWRPEAMPSMMLAAGLHEVDLIIERDTVYSKLPGLLDPRRRANLEDIFAAGLPRVSEAVAELTLGEKWPTAGWSTSLKRAPRVSSATG